MAAAAPAESQEVSGRAPEAFRVLAFEDNTDIDKLLRQAGIVCGEFKQKWTTDDAVATVSAFKPDVLLLDHFIPPLNGLQVLAAVNEAVAAQRLQRPLFIIAMSSQSSKNAAMVAAGADAGFVKWDVPDWPGWARRPEKD